MRLIRNLLCTIFCIAAIGAAVLFCYVRSRAGKETGLLNQGIALMEQGDYRLAREKFAQARQYENEITRYFATDSLEEDLYKYSAICDFRLGDLEAAASVYDRLLRIHPRDPSLMEARATVYAAQGQMDQAVSLFDMAIAIDSRNYAHIYAAALTLREYGNQKAGAAYLEDLLRDHADEIDDVTRGQALCYLERYEEAAEVFSRIENPDMQTTLMYASARESMGDHEEALALLDQFGDQADALPEMINLRGTAYCGLGRYEDALACFEKALPLAQEGTALQRSILFNRIAATEQLRDFDRAKELAAEYARTWPGDARMARENLFLQTR